MNETTVTVLTVGESAIAEIFFNAVEDSATPMFLCKRAHLA